MEKKCDACDAVSTNLTIKASLATRYILFLLKGPKGPSET